MHTDAADHPSPRSVRAALLAAREAGRAAFVPYLTVGYPSEEASLAIVRELDGMGADVIELGVPFSDPVADGPTIQRSTERALEQGMSLSRVLEIFATEPPAGAARLLFSYLNPLLAYGVDELPEALRRAHIGGVLITDLIPEETAVLGSLFAAADIEFCFLAASTSTDERLQAAASASSGFLYCISTLGVTGARQSVDASARATVERARSLTDVPIAVGFGIRSAEDVKNVASYADAVVVGSAMIDAIADATEPAEAARRARDFVEPLLLACAK